MTGSYRSHYPVFHRECLDFFSRIPNLSEGFLADLTFGGGGHSQLFLSQLNPLKVLGVDQDEQAQKNAQEKYKNFINKNKLELIKMNFSQFPNYWNTQYSDKKLLGIILDLGVSSHQFDSGERGFSFRQDAPLDMRMDLTNSSIPKAEDIINHYSQEDLIKVFRDYGEERFAFSISQKILEQRSLKKITRTKELEEIVFHCYPKKWRYGRTHPATKIFQALRIEVNQELKVLEDTLPQLLNLLSKGGYILAISFHSLEDRIVKNIFRKNFRENREKFKIHTKKPLVPSPLELDENPRSRSAKLRVLEKIG